MKLPDALVLLAGGVAIAAALTWVVPAGRYERSEDPATGRQVVVAGTYAPAERSPVGPFAALVAIPRGMADAGSVIFLVFLVGGAFTVVDRTGALRRGVNLLVARLGRREMLVIPAVSLFFALGGALNNMAEEIIALIPALLVLTSRMGFAPVVAVAMSLGAAAVGASFSPVNPFQVGIAQKLAQLPLLSGGLFRSAALAAALSLWVALTMRFAARTRRESVAVGAAEEDSASARDAAVLLIVLAAFATFAIGVARWGWDFDQMSAMFFAMGVVAGLVGGLRLSGTASAFTEGFAGMAYAAMLIGFARAIYVVLADGRIVDTLVHALFTPVEGMPALLSALGMMVAHVAVHVPVPSVSGQAVLTMPLLVPLSDLIGLSRQVTVLAYQFGAGLTDLLTPTNGALMAILGAAGVGYEQWLRFAARGFAALLALGALAVTVAVVTGLG